MRVVPLLVILLCGLSMPATPDMSVAPEPMSAVAASAADEADYLALQNEADLALAMLKQAQGRRLASLPFAVN